MEKNISRILIILLFCGLAWVFFHKTSQKESEPSYVKVSIELINTCQVFDEAFVVLVEPSGQIAFFNDKKTEIYARQDHKLRLAASPQYPDFAYDGSLVEVNPFIQLTADCAPPERIRNTLDALKEQFKK